MTHAYLALKKCNKPNTVKGHQYIMSDSSVKELNMKQLVDSGYFKELTEFEALEMIKNRKES